MHYRYQRHRWQICHRLQRHRRQICRLCHWHQWQICPRRHQLGLATECRSENIPWNRLGTVSVIPRKKLLIPRDSEVHGRVSFEARKGMVWKYTEKKLVLRNSQNNFQKLFVHTSKVVKCFGTEFREFASIFAQRDGIPSCMLLSLPRNGSESLILLLMHATEFRAFFSSAEWLGTEFREIASIFVTLHLIQSIFLLHGIVRKGIPRILRYVKKFFLLLFHLWTLYKCQYYSFSKIRSLTAAGMASCFYLTPKCQNLFPLVWD